jgi:hypothetical protein
MQIIKVLIFSDFKIVEFHKKLQKTIKIEGDSAQFGAHYFNLI